MARTPFAALAETFAKLEATSSSLKMIDILAGFFTRLSPEEARMAAYLLRGRVAPEFLPVELGIADKLVIRALTQSTGVPIAKIKQSFRKTGDLGDAAALAGNDRKRGPSLAEVFRQLEEIARVSGSGAQEAKVRLLVGLLHKCSRREAKYVVRIVLGRLRLGVAEMTFLSGLSKALTGSREHKSTLEYAYNVLSDLGEVAELAVRKGVAALQTVQPELGKPVRMMLAQRIRDVAAVPKQIPGLVHVEYKYDGERAQAHVWKRGGVVLFSRRLENITHQFPDVVAAIRSALHGKAAIVEGEVVAVDPQTGRLLDFQTLMRRRRKHEVEEYVRKIPVRYFLFDLLYLKGKSFLKKPLHERKKSLAGAVARSGQDAEARDPVVLAKYAQTQDPEEIESFFAEAVAWGAEGVVIKDAQSIYEAGTRGRHWIKYKKEYQEGLADTFDGVVIGGLYGKGARAGTYGSLLVAAFDPEANRYASFTKVGSGFTQEQLKQLPKKLRSYERPERHPLVITGMHADIWFDPALVMEVTGAQLTISPVHAVAKDKVKKGGLALRFPRFLRWRPDKAPEQATTVAEIYDLYRMVKRH
ncbi:MAG TPA: ATP-dependent DNA ligase [Gemmataceae bacterium]|nr:ATP-dependent DNA ligase [Gemmataceae bacterium]